MRSTMRSAGSSQRSRRRSSESTVAPEINDEMQRQALPDPEVSPKEFRLVPSDTFQCSKKPLTNFVPNSGAQISRKIILKTQAHLRVSPTIVRGEQVWSARENYLSKLFHLMILLGCPQVSEA